MNRYTYFSLFYRGSDLIISRCSQNPPPLLGTAAFTENIILPSSDDLVIHTFNSSATYLYLSLSESESKGSPFGLLSTNTCILFVFVPFTSASSPLFPFWIHLHVHQPHIMAGQANGNGNDNSNGHSNGSCHHPTNMCTRLTLTHHRPSWHERQWPQQWSTTKLL